MSRQERPTKIWVLRNVPYKVPQPSHLQNHSPNEWRQCVNLYVPLHVWSNDTHATRQAHVLSVLQNPTQARIQTFCNENEQAVPIVFYVHGGAFLSGDRHQRTIHEIMKALCRQGYLCVSVGYRLCRMRSWLFELMLLTMGIVSLWNVSKLAAEPTVPQLSSVLSLRWLLSSSPVLDITPPTRLNPNMPIPVAKPNQKTIEASVGTVHAVSTFLMWLCIGVMFLVLFLTFQISRWTQPQNAHPTSATDVAHAIRWVTHMAPVLGADPTRVVMMGHSAGAHLITNVLADPALWTETRCPRSSVRAVVGLSGLYSAECMRADAATRALSEIAFPQPCANLSNCFPVELLQKHDQLEWPPTLLLSAEFDYGLRAHTRSLYRVLKSRDCDVSWKTIRDVNHLNITCFWNYQHYPIRDTVLDFINQYA